MSSDTSNQPPKNARKVKYFASDPRSHPSSASPESQATFLRRVGEARASQPGVSGPGRLARASVVIRNVAIPTALLYCIFFVDWGPNDHVFSGPQRWLKRQKEAFWSLPSQTSR